MKVCILQVDRCKPIKKTDTLKDAFLQDRSIFAQHRGGPNAPELGRTLGKLNRVTESDGSQEPAGWPRER